MQTIEAPVESRRDARIFFGASDKACRDQRDEDNGPQGIRSRSTVRGDGPPVRSKATACSARWRCRFQRARVAGSFVSLASRSAITAAGRDARPETRSIRPRASWREGKPKGPKRQQGDDEAKRKRENTEAARPMRRRKPHAGPGDAKEKAGHDERGQHNPPSPLEEKDRARPPDEPLKPRIRGVLRQGASALGAVHSGVPVSARQSPRSRSLQREAAAVSITTFCRMILSKMSAPF